MMLAAVAAASPGTTRVRPASESPSSDVSMSSKYSIPAILATVRGGASPMRSIIAPASTGPGPVSDRDDDLSPGVSGLEIADGRGHLAQRIRAVDDRGDLPGLEQLAQDGQIIPALLGHEEGHLLAQHGRGHEHLDRPAHGPDPPALVRRPDSHQNPARGEHAPALRQLPAPRDVHQHVVAPSG